MQRCRQTDRLEIVATKILWVIFLLFLSAIFCIFLIFYSEQIVLCNQKKTLVLLFFVF